MSIAQGGKMQSNISLTPPGPHSRSLLGSLPDLQRDRLGFLLNTAQKYGDVVKYRMAIYQLMQVCHPDGIQHVLQENNHNYTKNSPTLREFRRVLGTGLFTSEGAFWLRQRRLMQPAFHRQRIAALGDMMVKTTQAMLQTWQPAIASRQPLDISKEMMVLTMEIACRALFSANIQPHVQEIGQAVTEIVEQIVFRFDHPFYPPPIFPTPLNRRYRAAMQALDRIAYELIQQRRSQPVEGGDLLSLLMEMRDEDTGEGMTDQELRDEVVILLIAGHETTATALSWTFYLLSQNPSAEQRLRLELAQVLSGRPPTATDLPSLPYTRMVIDESMRLYPPAWLTERIAQADDEICGYKIPAGTIIVVSPYVIHHHPAYWENPESFDPLRFLPERSAGRPRFAYFPFGGGPRMCIGNSLALTEAQLVLASVYQRCHLELSSGHAVEPLPLVTLRQKGGLWMDVQNPLPFPKIERVAGSEGNA
jgi:cytochrome P450